MQICTRWHFIVRHVAAQTTQLTFRTAPARRRATPRGTGHIRHECRMLRAY